MSEQTLSPDVLSYIDNLNKQLEAERTRRLSIENQLGQTSLGSSSKDQNVIEMQLEVEKTLDKIYHLLSGHEIKINPETNSEYWVEPEDDRLKTFSTYGVKQIINLLSMYLNINTLMGYYDEETIKWKVRDFGIELSDLFLNRYEALLYCPTPEDMYEKYKPIIKEQGLVISDEELYNKAVQWSKEELSAKENLLPIIALAIIDMVHSTYSRAFQGKERTSLGERGININQSNLGNEPLLMPQKKGGLFGFMRG